MPYFKYNSKNVYYNEAGGGEPLLLLHGNTASSRMFDSVVGLYEKDFRVIVIDFLGHGRSDRLDEFPADLWFDQALQVAEFLKYKGGKKVNIIGSSGGAIVALNVALETPEYVKRVIADSFEGEKPLAGFLETIEQDRELSKQDPGTRRFYEHNHGDDWESIVDNDTLTLSRHYNEIGRFYHKELNELTIPVLLTGSKADEFVTRGFFEKTYGEIQNKIPSARIHLFEEGGHPAMLSNGERFDSLARDFFLKKLM